jgi:hypothetical protein
VFLWANMVGTGTGIRVLRHLGIALVFAPEPFTTPFGVALILVARHLSKKVEANRNSQIREMVQYYLAHTGHFSDYAYGESGVRASANRHGFSKERAILGQITGSRSFEVKPSVRPGRGDTQNGTANHDADIQSLSQRCRYVSSHSDTSTRTEKVIHHAINMEWLSQRFESANSAVAHSSWTTTSGAAEGITQHSINMGVVSQHHRTGSLGHTRAERHIINIAQLRRRYGSSVDHTTALNGLRNNNHYYDMLSRRNVIGGY